MCVHMCCKLERALSHYCLVQSIFNVWRNKICLNLTKQFSMILVSTPMFLWSRNSMWPFIFTSDLNLSSYDLYKVTVDSVFSPSLPGKSVLGYLHLFTKLFHMDFSSLIITICSYCLLLWLRTLPLVWAIQPICNRNNLLLLHHTWRRLKQTFKIFVDGEHVAPVRTWKTFYISNADISWNCFFFFRSQRMADGVARSSVWRTNISQLSTLAHYKISRQTKEWIVNLVI